MRHLPNLGSILVMRSKSLMTCWNFSGDSAVLGKNVGDDIAEVSHLAAD